MERMKKGLPTHRGDAGKSLPLSGEVARSAGGVDRKARGFGVSLPQSAPLTAPSSEGAGREKPDRTALIKRKEE